MHQRGLMQSFRVVSVALMDDASSLFGVPGRMTTVQAMTDSAQARGLLKALADPVRLQIVEALAAGERCVCELTSELGLAQSRLSFHLKVLKDCGLLADRQSGRWVYYRLQPQVIAALQDWLGALALRSQDSALCCDD